MDYSFWVASEICQKDLYYHAGGQPGHLKAWQNDNINNNCNNFFKNTLDTLQKSWLRPRYDGYMYYQDIGGTLVNNYLRGEISIDIYPKGKNKAQVLDEIMGEVIFFGDRCEEGGNDSPIIKRLETEKEKREYEVFNVSNFNETWEILKRI